MEVTAKLKNAKHSAQKARLVIDQIRGLNVGSAINLLDFSKKSAAKTVKNVLNSAVANAEHNHGLDIDLLTVSSAFADEARTLKRIQPRAKGRANRILKRSCHITIKLQETSE